MNMQNMHVLPIANVHEIVQTLAGSVIMHARVVAKVILLLFRLYTH